MSAQQILQAIFAIHLPAAVPGFRHPVGPRGNDAGAVQTFNTILIINNIFIDAECDPVAFEFCETILLQII
jgi:hypothetical protein